MDRFQAWKVRLYKLATSANGVIDSKSRFLLHWLELVQIKLALYRSFITKVRFENPESFPDFGGMCPTTTLALLSPFHLPQLLKILCFDPLFLNVLLCSLCLYVRVQVRSCVPSPLESPWYGAWEREDERCSSAFLQSFDPHAQPASSFFYCQWLLPSFIYQSYFLCSLNAANLCFVLFYVLPVILLKVRGAERILKLLPANGSLFMRICINSIPKF